MPTEELLNQTGSTEVTGRADFSELLILLKNARRGAFIFALYNTATAREEVVSAVRRIVAPMPVFEWTYTPASPYPDSYLQTLTPEQQAERAVVFLFDLERGGDQVWKSLDYQRETFAQQPHSLVIWITSAGRVAAARKAPHFWAQRSTVFDFTLATERQQAELRGEWAGQELSVESFDDALRQLRLFQGLLDEYPTQSDVPPQTLNDLYTKVAGLLNYLDRREEALPYLHAQLELARQSNDREMEAQALTNLAQVERIRSGRQEAIALLEQALPLTSSPRLRAGILFNLGSALIWRGEADRSLRLLDEALRLFTQVGDKLGQANVLQAIGDVQQFRKQTADALKSYDEALRLFTQVGAKLGQASVRLSVGRMNDDADSFEQAVALYEKIGDTYSIARGKYYFALSLIRNGSTAQARMLLSEARSGWAKINFNPGIDLIDQELSKLADQ